MKTMIKKITTPILAVFLVFACLLQIPSVSGKYISESSSGTLWESIFTGTSIDLSTIFYITEEGSSKNLFGFDEKDEDGTIKNPNSVQLTDENGNTTTAAKLYELTNDVAVSFPAYNATSTPMLICFEVSICTNKALISSLVTNYNIEVSGTKGDNTGSLSPSFRIPLTGTDYSATEGLTIEKSAVKQYDGANNILSSSEYYLYTATLQTDVLIKNASLSTNQKLCFVLYPGETATYGVNVSGGFQLDEYDQIYASIKLVAVECTVDANGNITIPT